MMRRLGVSLGGIFLVLAALYSTVVIVDERESVIVSRFSAINRVLNEPGLHFKAPFIEKLYRYDDRLLTLDSDEYTIQFKDNRRLVVDAFTRWRIENVVDFHLAVLDRGFLGARQNLSSILEDAVRNVLGQADTGSILSADRTILMNEILGKAREPAAKMGVQIVDVRIIRADLPEANLQATYERMNAERKQEARDERARGAEAARRITAAASRQGVETVSDAKRESEIIKGRADAESNAILAKVYSRDPEFFDFYRSLEAYKRAIKGDKTSFVFSTSNDFLRYIDVDQLEAGSQGTAGPAEE